MAKIIEDIIIVKLSTLVKEDSELATVVTDEVQQSLEHIVQQLVGNTVVVEVEKA
jgi:hypothetical protein